MLTITWSTVVGCFVGWGVGWFCWGLIDQYLRDRKKKRLAEVEKSDGVALSMAVPQDVSHSTTPQMRIGFIDAMNGRILEVATQVPHPGMANHYDWKTEMYVVPEDQKLSEAISTVMLMKGLDR